MKQASTYEKTTLRYYTWLHAIVDTAVGSFPHSTPYT